MELDVRPLHVVTRDSIIEDFSKAKQKERDYIPRGVAQMGARRLWKETKGEGTVIAVLDSGVDINHPDLKENIIGGYNFTTDYGGDTSNFMDNHYHGTHVAGIIASKHNKYGIVGMAPEAKILALKVLTGQGSGSATWLANAIRYAISWRGPKGEKVNVINISLGTPNYNSNLHSAVKEAVANDIAVVVACGNDGDGDGTTNEISYPAYFQEVISVGAVDFCRNVTLFSNSNPEVDVCANGQDILSTYPGNKYAILNGTSMACPHVAGMCALFRGKFKNRFGRYPTEPELYQLIKFHTIDIGEAGIDAQSGAGYLTVFPDHVSAMKLLGGDNQ